jgi:hypothetical protein
MREDDRGVAEAAQRGLQAGERVAARARQGDHGGEGGEGEGEAEDVGAAPAGVAELVHAVARGGGDQGRLAAVVAEGLAAAQAAGAAVVLGRGRGVAEDRDLGPLDELGRAAVWLKGQVPARVAGDVEHEAGVGGGVGDAHADEAGGEVGVLDRTAPPCSTWARPSRAGSSNTWMRPNCAATGAAGGGMVPVPTT